MTLPIYQVDAFASDIFTGNPAAVIPLGEQWLSEKTMQAIASENNLSESVFFIKSNGKYHIRWFTPKYEVDLCGHATVAAAFVIKTQLNYQADELSFESKSGSLGVKFEQDWIYLDFPAIPFQKHKDKRLADALGQKIKEVWIAKDDLMVVLENEKAVATLSPNFHILKEINARGIICTAKSEQADIDFVSRFFAPRYGIDEDPVTGSAHTKLIPYWSKVLEKNKLTAKQISPRGGLLKCQKLGNRVSIGGQASIYLKGEIYI